MKYRFSAHCSEEAITVRAKVMTRSVASVILTDLRWAVFELTCTTCTRAPNFTLARAAISNLIHFSAIYDITMSNIPASSSSAMTATGIIHRSHALTSTVLKALATHGLIGTTVRK